MTVAVGGAITSAGQLAELPDHTVVLDRGTGERPIPYIIRNTELLGSWIQSPIGFQIDFDEWFASEDEGQFVTTILWLPEVEAEDAALGDAEGTGEPEPSLADSEPAPSES